MSRTGAAGRSDILAEAAGIFLIYLVSFELADLVLLRLTELFCVHGPAGAFRFFSLYRADITLAAAALSAAAAFSVLLTAKPYLKERLRSALPQRLRLRLAGGIVGDPKLEERRRLQREAFSALPLPMAVVVFTGIFLNLLAAVLAERFPLVQAAMAGGSQQAGAASPGMLIAVTAVLVPGIEEIVFRLFLYETLAEKEMRGANNAFPEKEGLHVARRAAVISSVLFGLSHGAPLQAVYALIMGFALCVIFELRGGLAASALTHACVNLLVSVLMFTGLMESLATPACCAAFGAIALLLAVAAFRRKAP